MNAPLLINIPSISRESTTVIYRFDLIWFKYYIFISNAGASVRIINNNAVFLVCFCRRQCKISFYASAYFFAIELVDIFCFQIYSIQSKVFIWRRRCFDIMNSANRTPLSIVSRFVNGFAHRVFHIILRFCFSLGLSSKSFSNFFAVCEKITTVCTNLALLCLICLVVKNFYTTNI